MQSEEAYPYSTMIPFPSAVQLTGGSPQSQEQQFRSGHFLDEQPVLHGHPFAFLMLICYPFGRMVVHATELLAAGNTQAEILLHEERHNLGGISMEELHRLVYAQVLSSHALTWQIAPIYLASCTKRGMALLKILLYKQPVHHNQILLKNIEICRLSELHKVSSKMMKIAGANHWKHGKKGSGVFWLQQARDEIRLSRIAQQLFDFVGKSISDESFKMEYA